MKQTAILRVALSLSVLVVSAIAGCGDDPDPTTPGPTTMSDSGGLSGSITVFAASSLTDVFTELGAAFEKANPEAKVEFSFAASTALVEQVKAGAPADVVATADEESLERLEREIRRRKIFARNALAIVVEAGNPLGIEGLADVAREDVTLVLCAAEVPCGKLAASVFQRARVTPSPRSLEANVKAVLSKVTLKEADAGVVYVTDIAAAGDKVEGVAIPVEQNAITGYPIAEVRASDAREIGRGFIDFVTSAEGQKILQAAGFAAP